MTLKKKIAPRDRNSREATAKKDNAIVARRKASVKELAGMFMSAFGMTMFFGRWDDPVVQITVLVAAAVLMVGGVLVALGDSE